MDYRKIYESLISRGKNRVLTGISERHHIIPRCMGGTDDTDNLVALTPEEHYLAHQLLVKIYDGHHPLVKAAMMMTTGRPSKKAYGWLRRRHCIVMSLSQTGSGNSQAGTRWVHNVTLKENKKVPRDSSLEEGWTEGRIQSFAARSARKRKKLEKEKQRIESKQTKSDEAYEWYNAYLNSGAASLREFVRDSGYDKSHVSFIRMLKTYVDDFSPTQGKRYSK